MAQVSEEQLREAAASQLQKYHLESVKKFVEAGIGDKIAIPVDLLADGSNSVYMANRMIEDFELESLTKPYAEGSEYNTSVWTEVLWPFAKLIARGLTEKCQALGLPGRFKIDIAADDGSVKLVYTKGAEE